MKKLILILIGIPITLFSQEIKKISKQELKDKIHGYWIGQLAGNYMGFPFESVYNEEPIPILIDRYYNFRDLDSIEIQMRDNDRRGYTNIMAHAMGGAWTDDDTDVEFVTLHAVEKYGLNINYEQITQMWKKHINRFIFAANRRARDLMEEGLIPPATGNKLNNERWYRITSQLVNEIWSAFYPGMFEKASERAIWGAKIMCDDWATHATSAYAIMYSAEIKKKNVESLVKLAMNRIPEKSPYRLGMENVYEWYKKYPNWRDTRKLIHDNYFESIYGFKVPIEDRHKTSVINGLSGIMAILYGKGDFTKTLSIATSAGYDCDNQAATCGGLIGVLNGAKAIPESFTLELPSRNKWQVPFNNQYINYSRDGLPNYNRIDDIVDRIYAIAEEAILKNGGFKKKILEKEYLFIKTDF